MTTTTIIPLDELIVAADRQRQQFNEKSLVELSNSIANRGLLQAPVVRLTDNGYRLVAGERRVRAITMLAEKDKSYKYGEDIINAGFIPVLNMGDIDNIAALEAELFENIHRENLTWQEQVKAANDLHMLRKEQTDGTQTVTATAKEIVESRHGTGSTIGLAHQRIRITRATLLSKYMDDPDIANAANEKEAFRIFTDKVEKKMLERAGVGMSQPAISTPEERKANPNRFYLGSMTEILPQLPQSTYDCILTDPPYGVGVAGFGGAAKFRHEYDESTAEDLHDHLFRNASRLLKDDGHMYIFCDIDMWETLKRLCAEYNFGYRRTPIIWHKGPSGHLTDGGVYGFRRSYELIFHCFKAESKRGYNKLMEDTIHISNLSQPDRFHAAQKPDSLYKTILQQSCLVGARVLDPFAGSGTIFTAAWQLDMVATGIESNEETAKQAALRRRVVLKREVQK